VIWLSELYETNLPSFSFLEMFDFPKGEKISMCITPGFLFHEDETLLLFSLPSQRKNDIHIPKHINIDMFRTQGFNSQSICHSLGTPLY